MASYGSKSGGGGGGIRAGENSTTEITRGGAAIGRLQALTTDSSWDDVRQAVRSISPDSTFYRYRVGDQGELTGGFEEITRTRRGDFHVGNRTMTEDELVRSIARHNRN